MFLGIRIILHIFFFFHCSFLVERQRRWKEGGMTESTTTRSLRLRGADQILVSALRPFNGLGLRPDRVLYGHLRPWSSWPWPLATFTSLRSSGSSSPAGWVLNQVGRRAQLGLEPPAGWVPRGLAISSCARGWTQGVAAMATAATPSSSSLKKRGCLHFGLVNFFKKYW